MVTDQQLGGAAVSLVIDRPTASRFGVTPSTIDNTLYDAFGQRQINTMYTQLNQYHVILETDPQFQRSPRKLNDIYVQASSGSGVTTPSDRTPGARLLEQAQAEARLTSTNLLTPSPTNGVNAASDGIFRAVRQPTRRPQHRRRGLKRSQTHPQRSIGVASSASSNGNVTCESTAANTSVSSSATTWPQSGTTRGGLRTPPRLPGCFSGGRFRVEEVAAARLQPCRLRFR